METQIQSKSPIVEPKRKILLVEDEQDIRELVRYNLESEGFSVVEASDGEIALKLAASERPALMILDLMLPSVPGLEVCRLLRTKEADAASTGPHAHCPCFGSRQSVRLGDGSR